MRSTSARVLFEPVGEPLVQVGAGRLRERVVGGVADQEVLEAERVLAVRAAAGRAGSAPCARARRAAAAPASRRARAPARRRGGRSRPRPRPARARSARPGSSWSRRAASSACSVGGTTSSPSAWSAIASISCDEERVPARRAGDPLAQRAGDRAPGSARRRPRRPSGSSRSVAGQEGRRSSSSGRAMQSSRIGAPAERSADLLDQVEERLLAPVDVVEDDDERSLGGCLLERLAERPRDLLRPSSRVSSRRAASGSPPRPPRRPAARRAAQHLDDRPVGDALAVGQAAAAHDPRVDRREQLRLRAGTCRRRRRRRPSPARSARSACTRSQASGSSASSRSRPTNRIRVRALRRARVDGHEPVGRRPARSARRARAARPARRSTASRDERERRLADQHLARRRGLLEPPADRDRVAGDEAATRAGSPATTSPVLTPIRASRARAPGSASAHLDCRAQGAQRVVLVHDRDAEHGHQPVADELLDRAAVPLDDRRRELEAARHQRAQRLGIEPPASSSKPTTSQNSDRHRSCAPPRRLGPRMPIRHARARPRGGHGAPGPAAAGRSSAGSWTQDLLLELLQRLAGVEAELVDEPWRARPGRRRARLPAGRRGRARGSAAGRGSRAAGGRGRAPSSSPTTSVWRPSARSASRRSSSAASRSSSSRPISLRANASYSNSASGGPRHSPSASRSSSPACCGVTLGEPLAAPLEQSLEPLQVERARLDPEQVPGRPRLEHALVEQLAQLRDLNLHRLDRGRRRPLAPELVHEPRCRHQLVRAQEQHGEHRPLLRPAQRQLTAFAADGERAQDPELHAANVTPDPEKTRRYRAVAASSPAHGSRSPTVTAE